jgi:hypothetical protein
MTTSEKQEGEACGVLAKATSQHLQGLERVERETHRPYV